MASVQARILFSDETEFVKYITFGDRKQTTYSFALPINCLQTLTSVFCVDSHFKIRLVPMHAF